MTSKLNTATKVRNFFKKNYSVTCPKPLPNVNNPWSDTQALGFYTDVSIMQTIKSELHDGGWTADTDGLVKGAVMYHHPIYREVYVIFGVVEKGNTIAQGTVYGPKNAKAFDQPLYD